MEIEAKFAVTDKTVAKQLQTVETIAGMTLTDGGTESVHDTYLDTQTRRLFAAGFVCRRRRQNDSLLITLKQIDEAPGAIHKREELEVVLTEDRPPSEWPASPARDRVMDLIVDQPLRALFELRQTRVLCHVLKDHSVVAEWSLDNVSVRRGNEELRFVDLEIELAPQGVENDLTTIAARVQEEWGLAPEMKSKFQRALAWVNEPGKS